VYVALAILSHSSPSLHIPSPPLLQYNLHGAIGDRLDLRSLLVLPKVHHLTPPDGFYFQIVIFRTAIFNLPAQESSVVEDKKPLIQVVVNERADVVTRYFDFSRVGVGVGVGGDGVGIAGVGIACRLHKVQVGHVAKHRHAKLSKGYLEC